MKQLLLVQGSSYGRHVAATATTTPLAAPATDAERLANLERMLDRAPDDLRGSITASIRFLKYGDATGQELLSAVFAEEIASQ